MALVPSAPAHRLVDLVAHLAARPGEAFTVTELARDVGLNRATCQSIVMALEERGWVQRRDGKHYAVGAALIPVGEAALAGLRLVDAVRPGLDALVAALGLEALASVVSSGEIVVIAHAKTGAVSFTAVRVGQTLPFVPPFGLAHLVSAPVDRIETWLDRAPTALDERERAAYRAAIRVAQERGYVVTLDAESRRRFEQVVAELAEHPGSVSARRRRDQLLVALAHEEHALGPRTAEASEVSQIAAPVFGPDGRVAAALGVHGFPHQIDALRIPVYAEHVLRAATQATRAIHGRRPAPAAGI